MTIKIGQLIMKIVQISPGTGDSFYCENCLRDSILAKQMAKLGHDVVIVPMYLPLGVDWDELGQRLPMFFGGINVYLQQKSSLFNWTPRWLSRWLDSERLLRYAAQRVGMTSARLLGRTTISMLRGQQGRQKKELRRLLQWLSEQTPKPDLICLSNILLGGLVQPIKAQLALPVVSLLQDEDTFLDGLAPPYSRQAWDLVGQCCSGVDAFIAVSKYYAKLMQNRLSIGQDRMHVVPTGIQPHRYDSNRAAPNVPTIGYLSRMCPDRGLDTLVDAFVILKAKHGLKDARLRIAGGATLGDKPFVDQIKKDLQRQGLLEDVEFLPDFDWPDRANFLKSLSLLCVPEKHPVAGGIYVLEAWAAGLPVVEPDMGAFRELVGQTGGGLLYEPGNTAALAQSLAKLLRDPQLALDMGQRGTDAVHKQYNIERTAQSMAQVFDKIVSTYK